MSNPIDLTTVANVRSWLQGTGKYVANPDEDPIVQSCITAASVFVLRHTGRGADDGQVPAQSPFNQPVAYDEWYDGNGNDQLMLRNWPVVSVTAVNINGASASVSGAVNGGGIAVSRGNSLVFRHSGGVRPGYGRGAFGACGGFSRGKQNIEVQYTAGFNLHAVTNELQAIPASPFTVSALTLPWLSDVGVSFFVGGAALTKVFSAPASGQYFIQANGVYMFNVADTGKQVLLSYNAAGTPADLELAVRQLVAVNYKRKNWIDQKMQAMANGAGTTSYRDWAMPPEVVQVFEFYKRRSV